MSLVKRYRGEHPFGEGVDGFVPGPTAAEVTANKVLQADGTWVAAGGGGGGDMDAATYDPASVSEQLVGLTAAQTLTSKTLTTPTIASMVNAQHDHASAAGGGAISHADLDDIGSNTHAVLDTHVADGGKHREINDAGTGATELWSASQIDSEFDAVDAALAGKSDTGHSHAASDIVSGTLTDARVAASNVTQHALALLRDSAVCGTSFPVSPTDQDVFFRKDHQEWYKWIASLSAWYSREYQIGFGKGGTGFNNTYLRFHDSIGGTGRGVYIPYDISISGLAASWTTTATTGNIRVRRNATNTYAADLAVYGDSNTTLTKTQESGAGSATWISFAKNGRMTCYLDTLSAGINHPHVLVYYRRRET